jgi:hypothetical protein
VKLTTSLCLLGHKNPVHTLQETHYVYATEPSRLLLWKILGVHHGDYEECRLLRRYAVWLLKDPMFRRNSASIIRVTRIGELGTTLAVTSNRRTLRRNITVYIVYIITLMMEALLSSQTSVITRATRRTPQKTAFFNL